MAQRSQAAEIDAVKADLGALRADIEKLVKSMSADASAKSKQALNSAKESLNDYAEAAKARGQEGVAIAEKQIEQNPFTSVAAAFGIGLIAGRLLSR